jgi:PAS domain S-box-containing protein
MTRGEDEERGAPAPPDGEGAAQALRDGRVLEALQRSPTEVEMFRELLESSDLVHVIRSPDGGTMEWVSPSYERLFGRSRESLYADSRSWLAAVLPADRARIAQLASANPRGFEAEYRIARPDGAIRWVRGRTFPLGGEAEGRLASFAEDITARKASEARFSQLADTGIIGIVISDPDRRILEINDALLVMIGYSREEIVSGAVPWSSLTPPEWRRREEEEELGQTLAADFTGLREKEYLRKDGRRVPVLIGTSTRDGGRGETLAFILDLTERKRAERAVERLRQERVADARFRGLLEAAPDAMVITDGEDRIVLVNAQTEKMFGHPREALLDRGIEALIPRSLHEEHRARRRAAVAAGGSTAFELVGLRHDGATFPVEITVGVLRTEDTELWSSAIRDITQRKNSELALTAANEALRLARDAADTANRAKSAFLANMSHEIRTPMNAILGYTQLLQRDPRLEGKQLEHLASLSRGGEHLLQLINDVLEMSKIEAGHREVARGNVDLHALVDDLERMFRLRADGAGLSFEIVRDVEAPRYLMGDEGKLRQVLVNLLGNAMKFTQRGGVAMRLLVQRVRRGQGGEERLVAEIRDTGPGITAEELGRLFQPFAQAQVGLDARGGTGLGLALSREFARLMGGDITVESTPGAGSLFRLDLPLERSDPPSILPASRARARVAGVDGPAPRTLVVDDDADNRGWLVQLLTLVGFDVRAVTNGAEALESFRAWSPHLVLMDLNMPIMDGYAAMRAIRALPGGAAVTIVAVTASAFDDARQAIFDAGADGWLRKPCREGELLAEIRRHLGVTYRYAEPAASVTSSLRGPLATAPITALPPDLLEGLRTAVLIADHDRLGELIRSLPPAHAALAEALARLAQGFAYDELAALLQG